MYTLTVMFIVVSLAVFIGLGTIFTSYGKLEFLVMCHFLELSTSAKSAPILKENACEPNLSVVSFLPGLALMKTTVWNQHAHSRISGWITYGKPGQDGVEIQFGKVCFA